MAKNGKQATLAKKGKPAPATLKLARTLVTCETHGRRAVLDLMQSLGDLHAETHDARAEINCALDHAKKLPRQLLAWTAQVANPKCGASHIDMMCHLSDFARGAAALSAALNEALPDEELVEALDGALTKICGAHRKLVKWCRKRGIPIPDYPTTEDGGGR